MKDAIEGQAAHLLQQAPVGIAACDAEGRVLWANPALGALLGAAPETIVGLPVTDLLGSRVETVDEVTCRGTVTLDGGVRRWIEMRTAPAAVGGDGPAMVCSFADISAFESRGKARAAVAAGIEASRLDADTGLLNRRATLQELNAQVSRSRRYGNPLSVLGMSLHGVLETDAELRRRLARHLRESLRWVDSAGVMGTDEMVVVLPETDLEAARTVAEKLRARLREDGACADAAAHIAVAAWNQPDDAGALLERLRLPAAA